MVNKTGFGTTYHLDGSVNQTAEEQIAEKLDIEIYYMLNEALADMQLDTSHQLTEEGLEMNMDPTNKNTSKSGSSRCAKDNPSKSTESTQALRSQSIGRELEQGYKTSSEFSQLDSDSDGKLNPTSSLIHQ
jgi:hypothetical protein